MVNIAIMTSDDNNLTEEIVKYFHNYQDAQISCVISNKDNSIIKKRLRRYKLKHFTTDRYKEIDKILQETETNYIMLSDFDQSIPTNFKKKYKYRIFDLQRDSETMSINFVLSKKNEVIYSTENRSHITIEDLCYKFYPTIVENTIRTLHE